MDEPKDVLGIVRRAMAVWCIGRDSNQNLKGGDFPGGRLRLDAPNAGDPDSIPGQGIRSHMPQLKIPHAARKIKDPRCCN